MSEDTTINAQSSLVATPGEPSAPTLLQEVMVDLETMGTSPSAAIVAIGAAPFNLTTGQIGEPFYRVVDLQSAVNLGGEMDPDTVLWWLKQSDNARAVFGHSGRLPLIQALLDLSEWMRALGQPEELRVWGNGAGFDNVILGSAYRRAGQTKPWGKWNDRCYRTLKAMHPGVKLERSGVHHHAADDALSQARHLVAMLREAPEQARQVNQLRGERLVLTNWMADALTVLETLRAEDSEDGGEQLRRLCTEGNSLVNLIRLVANSGAMQ